MDAALLGKLFGPDLRWHGSCTIILDAEASVQTIGTDSIVSGGAKVYAPRTISGRICADLVCWVAESHCMLIIQQQRVRQATGDELVKQTLTIADSNHIVAVEFFDVTSLALLGVPAPAVRPTGSTSGIHPRPKLG